MWNRPILKITVDTIDDIPLARIVYPSRRAVQPSTEVTIPFHRSIRNISRQNLAMMLNHLYQKKQHFLKTRGSKQRFSFYEDIVILSVFKVNEDQLFNKETQIILQTLESLLKKSEQMIDQRCNKVLADLRNKDIEYLLRSNQEKKQIKGRTFDLGASDEESIQIVEKRVELIFKYIEGKADTEDKLKQEDIQQTKSLVDILRNEEESIVPERSMYTGFSRIKELKQKFMNYSNSVSKLAGTSNGQLDEAFRESQKEDNSTKSFSKKWKEAQNIKMKAFNSLQQHINYVLNQQGIDQHNFSQKAKLYEAYVKKRNLQQINQTVVID